MALIAAVEHIDRQTDNFPRRLEEAIGMLQEEIRTKELVGRNIDGHPLVKKIEGMVFDRFGLRISLFTSSHLACILPYYSNRNHIFLSEFFRGNLNIHEQSKLLRLQEGKTGTVNLHKATVSGIFSEYDHPVYMNFGVLSESLKMTREEIAAVFLHEIGHGFNACYYSDRTDRVNQVLATINSRLMDRRGEEDLEYIYKELHKLNTSVKKEEVDQLLNGNRVVAGVTWFKFIIGTVRNMMQHDRYNDTAYEELSDSFSARFGYGLQLVTALDKISTLGAIEKHPAMIKFSYLLEFLVIAGVMLIIGATIINPASIILGVYIAVMSLFWTYVAGEDFQDYTYDKLKDRYLRIRKDIVDQLKDKKLNPTVVRGMLDQIYDVDTVIKETYEHRGLLNRISNLIFSSNRDALTSIEAQKLLESLASNDLFVASAKLRTLKD